MATDVPDDVIRSCGLLWISQGALALGSTARSCMLWLARRDRTGHTVLDLDYRAALWPDLLAARAAAQAAIALSTVVVGNREECHMAVGTDDPEAAADALLAAGVNLAIVKLGADGSLLATVDRRWHVAPVPVEVVCGLGAGDAFGGALSHGLLSGWDVERIGRFANAAGAFVSAQLTCADAMPSIVDLDAMVSA
jgi:5-dehydro-2-deoxygluconokinase